MARAKKPLDYIKELCSSRKAEQQILGKILMDQYGRWTETLVLEDFLNFNETIIANKSKIGAAQFFGKFRAYAFEEYVYRLLKEKVAVKKPLEVSWGEKCLVWRMGDKNYAMEFDVSIGRKVDDLVDPQVVFDAKVELDSARLKTAVASFAVLKRWKPAARCLLVYIARELDSCLLELVKGWVDGAFQLSRENNETDAFLSCVAECLNLSGS